MPMKAAFDYEVDLGLWFIIVSKGIGLKFRLGLPTHLVSLVIFCRRPSHKPVTVKVCSVSVFLTHKIFVYTYSEYLQRTKVSIYNLVFFNVEASLLHVKYGTKYWVNFGTLGCDLIYKNYKVHLCTLQCIC